MNINDFSGAKLAIFCHSDVLVLRRDGKADIPFPGKWDFPGGGREGDETPLETASRETFEEAGLRIDASSITYQKLYPNAAAGRLPTWFLVAKPGWLARPHTRLGDEGQELAWMPAQRFLDLPDAVPHLQDRLREYLATLKVGA